MITRTTAYTIDLDRPTVEDRWDAPLTYGDKSANIIQATLMRGAVAAALSNATVMLYGVLSDGTTAFRAGTVSGNVVTCELDYTFYAVPGKMDLLVQLSEGTAVANTPLRITAHVKSGQTDELVSTGEQFSLAALQAIIAGCETATENAGNAADSIDNMTVAASPVSPGGAPTAAVSDVEGHKHVLFGIPSGLKGDTGASITSAAFDGDNIVLTKDDDTTVTLEDAVPTLTGPQGVQGVRGSKPWYGTDITGTSTTPTAYATGISDAIAGDLYHYNGVDTYNSGNEYRCTVGGNAATALWVYNRNVGGIPVGSTEPTGEQLAWVDTSEEPPEAYDLTADMVAEDGGGSVQDALDAHTTQLADVVSEVGKRYEKSDADKLYIAMLTKDNYYAVMRAWFEANGAGIIADLSVLCERWYQITRTGWEGGTQFWQPDQSSLSTGTKVGDNAGMTCVPSTNTTAGQDDYAGVPLFAPIDCNWYLDDAGKRHIRAIKGVDSLYAYVNNEADKPVGVIQMAPWIKVDEEETTYTYWMTDKAQETGYVPVAESVDLDGTVHSWVVHSKYGMGDAYSSISGVPTRVWDVSHNSQIASIRTAMGSNVYCGKSCADDTWMKFHVYIKYASLTLDNIMNGCCSYYNKTLKPAVAETGVKRVLVTAAQAAGLLVGSTVCLGSAAYANNKAAQCSVVDRAKIVSIETVEVGGVSYSALNLNVSDNFDATTELFLTTMSWYAGSCDDVKGNDGSPYSNTSSKEPYKLQGIEQSYGFYEIIGDTILQYGTVDGQNVLCCMICRNAKKITTSVTADYEAAGYTVGCPAASAWMYIRKLGFNAEHPDCMFAIDIVGGSSSTFTRDAIYILAAASGVYGWRALGYLNNGLANAGLSCADVSGELSNVYWSFGGRLSPNGSRGEYVAQAA